MTREEFKRQYRIARLLNFRASLSLHPDFNEQLLSLVDSRVATCFNQRQMVEGFRNSKDEWATDEWATWQPKRFLSRQHSLNIHLANCRKMLDGLLVSDELPDTHGFWKDILPLLQFSFPLRFPVDVSPQLRSHAFRQISFLDFQRNN